MIRLRVTFKHTYFCFVQTDSQFDFYGTRLATCDSNGEVRINRIQDNQVVQQPAVFSAHSGPCWQISWAHPKFENVIATCGYDRGIRVWKEVQINNWQLVYQVEADSSVNSI